MKNLKQSLRAVPPKKRITIPVSAELHARLLKYAAERGVRDGVKRSRCFSEIIEAGLERERRENIQQSLTVKTKKAK